MEHVCTCDIDAPKNCRNIAIVVVLIPGTLTQIVVEHVEVTTEVIGAVHDDGEDVPSSGYRGCQPLRKSRAAILAWADQGGILEECQPHQDAQGKSNLRTQVLTFELRFSLSYFQFRFCQSKPLLYVFTFGFDSPSTWPLRWINNSTLKMHTLWSCLSHVYILPGVHWRNFDDIQTLFFLFWVFF